MPRVDSAPVPDAVEAMPDTPDVVLEGDGDGDGDALDGEAGKPDEDAEAGGDDMVAKETVGDVDDSSPAGESDEDGGVGVQLDESNVAMDDPIEAGASLIVDDSNAVSVGGGDSFHDQIGGGIHGGADEGAQFGHDVQDDGPRMDKNVAVNDDDENVQDEGPRMDAVATTLLNDVEAELVKGNVAVDDSTWVGASLIDDDSNVVSVGGRDCFVDQVGQKTGGGTHDGAAQFGHDMQDDGPRMDKNVAVSNDIEDAQDEEGVQMDAVATTVLNDVETELIKPGDDVAEVCTKMETLAPSGDGNEEEGVATAGDAAKYADWQMDAVAMNRDDNKEKATGAAGVEASGEGLQVDTAGLTGDDNEEEEVAAAGVVATGEDIQVDTVGLTEGDNNQEEEVAAFGGDDGDEEGMQKDVVTTTVDVAEEDVMAGQNIVEEAADLPEEAEVEMVGNDIPEEEALQIDEDEEDGMAGQTVAEESASLLEEAEVDMVGNDIPDEEAVQIDEDDDDDEPPPLTRKGGGRRKRGRPSSKAQAVVKSSVKRKDDEEEVCFICFDGGDLVVCDRRGCPKAYHPSCVNRDDEFFKSKGRWNCGWHICSNCQKTAHQMCYTCTYSLCKVCVKETKFICLRINKGFCETCLNTVMLIENKDLAPEPGDVDFDDKNSWWYLFKEYWLNLKAKLSLTVEEISVARSQKNGSSLVICGNDLSELPDTNDEEEANSDSSPGPHLESSSSKKRGKKRLKNSANEDSPKGKERIRKSTKQGLSGSRDAKCSTGTKVRKLSKRASSSEHRQKESESVGTSTSSAEEASWASKELLDFVAHMRNGDNSVLSQFDVQALLLDYIKLRNLRDPRRKSQIVCDPLLKSLFGKERVGHFEMLKLLESHFLTSEVSPIDIDDNHGGVVDPDPSQDADGNSEASVAMSSEKRRKSRKYDQRALQTNLDDYAAIDNHNISLIYLRRNLMEELIGDVDTFDEKVLGSFVRIRISGTGQRQDIYRLVQIVGTGTAAEKYKCGKKTTDMTLEILNLDKKEAITIDITSNQEFTEEECKRLRQSIKCGFIPRLTVGEVQEKARVLQALKVNDWIESEKMRLAHLRDRASDMGHRKELRECVEKLQLLSTPEERARRLNEEPEIHADPTMDPDYESPEEQEQDTERSSSFNKSRGSFFRRDTNPVSPSKGEGRNAAQRDAKTNWESNRNTWSEPTTHLESPLGRRSAFSSHGENAGYAGKADSPKVSAHTVKMEAATGNAPRALSGISSEALAAHVRPGVTPASQSTVNESEKIWQYMDPSSKVQGPFSIIQLRKWNSSGYFPPSLKIWKSSETQDDSILLADALVGKFEKDLPPWEPPLGNSSQIDKTYLRSNSDVGARPHSNSLPEESTKAAEQTSKSAIPTRSQSFSGKVGQRHDYDTANLGSNMIQSGAQGYYGMQSSQAAYASQQSLTGSWNTSSGQFGTTVNPMALSQPVMGGFSVGQNNAVAGNVGQLTPVPASATSSAEVVNSQLLSQNQIASVLPQRDARFVDGNDSKSGADASHGWKRSSGEHLGPVGAQPGAAQSNTQQLEEGRNQSTDASNSMLPSQLMSTPSAELLQPSATTITGGDSQSSGWAIPAQVANTSGQAQGAGNMTWEAALQNNASMAWGMMGQTNMNMPWVAPAQGATSYNMGLTMPTQPNIGWVTPNPGNTNMNMIWATQGQGTPNAATMMGAQMQGVAVAPWGTQVTQVANSYPGWATQVGNMNQNVGWVAPVQGNPGPSPVDGTGQGNNNMNWNSPSGNRSWNNQQHDNGSMHSGHVGDFNSGGLRGRPWRSQSGRDGGSQGHRGICFSIRDRGFCRNGERCIYLHTQTDDGYASKNDRRIDRQPSSNERRFDRQNERNDQQFDQQPSGNERHSDSHDDMQNDRDNNRHDDRQG